ncbi:MAG: pyruvate kinase [Clostridiales bacterium]|nr:pyruvate kinase [Clostridiales bacterium]
MLDTLKTKIVCTIGPASNNAETIRDLINAGMDVARLNFSHGTHEGHKIVADTIKRVRGELNSHTALLLDTKGPEIRLGDFTAPIVLERGAEFRLTFDDSVGDEKHASVTYKELWRDLAPDRRVLIDDGLVELKVIDSNQKEILCRVLNGGNVSSHKGVNVPGVKLSIPFLSERDIADIKFGIAEDFDFIAASFTQCAADIEKIRELLEKNGGGNIRIIAKIENAAGVENIDEIIKVSDAIMVARGDMGVEIPMEEIPIIQKKLISKAYSAGKPVITATQMLESMTKNPRPTRAEITDVANAIYDGTSAIMLSGETAAGNYPVESVRTMSLIASRTEGDINYIERFRQNQLSGFSNVTTAISHAACTTAHDLGANAVIAVTKSGTTARMISRFRPVTPIIGCSPDEKVCRQLSLSWGVTPMRVEEQTSTDALFEHAISVAASAGYVEYGDLAVITAGLPIGIAGTTNILKVQIVGDVLTSGTGISSGTDTVCGTLCVCRDEEEARQNFRDGEILVIPSTSNRIVDLLRHARGIICEIDGEDSHAAIVGQALGIPVIVGALGATKILKSGTTVTVDAKRGTVYCGA